MLSRLALAVVVAVVVTLACVLLGDILGSIGIQVAETIGSFLTRYSTTLGILAGIWYFFGHG